MSAIDAKERTEAPVEDGAATGFSLADIVSGSQEEAARQMSVCNACRYCEGLCAVFPAMELRRTFGGGDVDYLSNLCHNCGACYYDCQYAPPHEFGINVPVAMAELRDETYARYAWPRATAVFFDRNAFWVTLAAVVFDDGHGRGRRPAPIEGRCRNDRAGLRRRPPSPDPLRWLDRPRRRSALPTVRRRSCFRSSE